MRDNCRGAVFLILYLLLLFVIGAVWNLFEVYLYGYSQESIMDAFFCIQPSYTIAMKITDLIHKKLRSRKTRTNSEGVEHENR